jgi:hypothetical protein
MTSKEAIKYLIALVATSTKPSAEYLKQKGAYDLAIKALKREECKDIQEVCRSCSLCFADLEEEQNETDN